MSKRISRSTRISQVKQLITGSQKHNLNGNQPFPVGGANLTQAQAAQSLQDVVDTLQGVETAKAALKAKQDAARAQQVSQDTFVNAYETIIKGMLGNSADVLADFGLAPRKARKQPSAEEKAVAAAKRNATREARHTMGKNQKKTVKGAVAPASPPAPAGSTPAPTPSK